MLFLSFFIGLAAATPAYYNNRQEGSDYNVDFELEDSEIVVVPFKAMVDSASSALDFAAAMLGRQKNSTVGRAGANILDRMIDLYKQGTASADRRSGRRYQLSEKGVKSDRNENPNEIPRIGYIRTEHFNRGPVAAEKVDTMVQAPQTVNVVQPPRIVEEDEEEFEDDEEPYEPTKTTSDDSLTLVGGGLEECGPGGHRNNEGICEFLSVEETITK